MFTMMFTMLFMIDISNSMEFILITTGYDSPGGNLGSFVRAA